MSIHTPTEAAAEYSTNLESPQSQPATKGDIQHLEAKIDMLMSTIAQIASKTLTAEPVIKERGNDR